MKTESYYRAISVTAILVAIAASVYILRLVYEPIIRPIFDVIPPFAIGFVIAFLLDPVVDWLQRRGFSRGFGVLVVGLSFLTVFVAVGVLVIPKVLDQTQTLANNFDDIVSSAQSSLNDIIAQHKELLSRLHLPTTTGEWTARYSNNIQDIGKASLGFLSSMLTSTLSKILWIIIIPMSTFLLLKDFDYFKAKVVHLTPERHRPRMISLSSAVGNVFGQYVRGMIAVAILYSIVASVILTAFGVQYALIIGVLSGLFYLVPYLGNVFIVGMAFLAALFGMPAHSLVTAGVILLILLVQSMIVFDMIITPRIAGGSVGVHPILALFSLALGAQMFGVPGMVLAVPVVASLQVILGQLYPKLTDDISQNTQRHQKESRK